METDLVLTFLLNALWQVPAVVLAATLGETLLRRAPARLRHALWLAALAACVLLPAASLIPEAPETETVAPVAAAAMDLPVAAASLPGKEEEPRLPALPPLVFTGLALVYGLSLLAGAVRLGRSWWRARELARAAWRPALSPEAAALVERCRTALDLDGVEILASDEIPGPLTLGALRPLVLLPAGFLEEATPDELTASLGHEMAHIRRRDYALHLLCEALLVTIAFHPAVRRLRRRLAETREMACDEATVERLIGARAYARSLLSLAASVSGLPRPVFTLGAYGADTLEVRMKRLTDPRSRLGARLALASLSLALVLLAATGLAASSMAVRATAAEDAGALTPFLGVWRGEFADKDGRKVPSTELEVRVTNGRPEGILTMRRFQMKGDALVEAGTADIPVYGLRADGRTLTFQFRTALSYRPNERKEVLEHTSQLELTGEGEGLLRSLGGKTAADPSRIPPPPPPHVMKRIR